MVTIAAKDGIVQRERTTFMPFGVLAAKGFFICLYMCALAFYLGGHKQNINEELLS